jgi:putative acetyltransferase
MARPRTEDGIMSWHLEQYTPRNKQAFYDLNIWWLEEFFKVEPIDERVLSEPEKYILDKGGEIFFAVVNGKAVGTVAMKAEEHGVFELTKLAVDPNVQQGGMGSALCEKVIERFKARGGKKLYLETNTKLTPAIKLYWKLGFVELKPEAPSPYERANYYMEWKPEKDSKGAAS